MRAVESVNLMGGRSELIFQRFAAAMRGDYQKKWASFSDNEKREFLFEFDKEVEEHAISAFKVGVEYGENVKA